MTHRNAIALSVVSALVAGTTVFLVPRKPADDKHLPVPGRLSATVGELLRHRMARHGQDMTELAWSVVLLDYDDAARTAERIAADTSLARPLGADATELNSQLPERFFELQDRLRAQSARVGAAARARNADELGDAHAELQRTCVACHRIYVEGVAPPRAVPSP